MLVEEIDFPHMTVKSNTFFARKMDIQLIHRRTESFFCEYVMMKATIWERTQMGIAGMCRYCLMVGKYG